MRFRPKQTLPMTFLTVLLTGVLLNMTPVVPLLSLRAKFPRALVIACRTTWLILAEFAKVTPLMLGRLISVCLAVVVFATTPIMFVGRLVRR